MTTRVCLERTIPHYDGTGLETPWLSAARLERRISHYGSPFGAKDTALGRHGSRDALVKRSPSGAEDIAL